MSGVHSRVSPSNELAVECPNSVWKQQRVEARNGYIAHKIVYQSGVDNREEILANLGDDTTAAELGTLMHTIRENAIKDRLRNSVHDAFNEHDIDNDYAEGRLQEQADYIADKLSIAERGGVEAKVVNLGTDSGGKCDSWWLIGETITVEDLKSGRIPVVAENKYSMKRYACGLLDSLGWPKQITQVNLRISAIQFPDSSWTISVEDLREWRDTKLYGVFDRVYADSPDTVAGKHCEYCRARRTCNEAHQWAVEVVHSVAQPTETSIESLEKLYINLKGVAEISEALRDEIEMRLSLSGVPPKILVWKAGRKVSTYTATNDEILNKVKSRLTTEILYRPRKPLTKTTLVKMYKHNEKMQEALKTFSVRKGVNQFDNILEDTSPTLAPKQLKTKVQLKDIFSHEDATAFIDTYDESLLEEQLADFIGASLVLEQQPVSVTRLRNLVGQETINDLIKITQTKHIG